MSDSSETASSGRNVSAATDSTSSAATATTATAAVTLFPSLLPPPPSQGLHHDDSTTTSQVKNEPVAEINSSRQEQDNDAEEGVSAFYDLIAGGVAGSASVIVGHPFDTIKVRIQTSAAGKASSLASMATSFGGLSSLYRGMGAPLVSASAINALIFSSYATSSRYWDEHFASTTELAEEEETGHDSWPKAFCCGSFAGLIQCIIICPTEHVKCRLQIQHGKGAADNIYNGSFQAATSIARQYGVGGLFRGWWATAWREVPAFGLYFAAYDFCKDRVSNTLAAHAGLTDDDDVPHSHLWVSSTLAGGISGSMTWGVIYPIDVIKSRIQTAPMETPLHERRIWTVGRALVAKYGWPYMFRGLGITLIRAFPVNGIIFPVYEFTLLHLTGELTSNDD